MFNRAAVQGMACLVFACLALTSAEAALFGKDETPDEQRAAIQKMHDQTMKKLYKEKPKARAQIEKAAGYAVFSNFGMKILVAGGGAGKGVAIGNKTQQKVYMKMAEIQAGLGFGIKKFRLVWVFLEQSDFDRFVNSGWELGGQSTVAAQVNSKGADVFAGAVSITPGVWLYQLTDDGLALELTANGTKYYKDKELN